MKRTPEEKRAHYAKLRKDWQDTKRKLTQEEITKIDAIIESHGWNVSRISFFFVSRQMERLNYDGIPYLDCKTFDGWKQAGFMVRKGEKSRIEGITWIDIARSEQTEDQEDDKGGYMLPRAYHLFHRSQVA